MPYIKLLTTEGDVEGKSTDVLARFTGETTDEQIITYAIEAGLKPYYHFHIEKEYVNDASDIDAKVKILSNEPHGRIVYEMKKDYKLERLRKEGLAKLTLEERKALGV